MQFKRKIKTYKKVVYLDVTVWLMRAKIVQLEEFVIFLKRYERSIIFIFSKNTS